MKVTTMKAMPEILNSEHDFQRVLAQEICEFTHDPLGFSDFAFPWGKRDLESSEGPYKWQTEIFELIGNHLQNPKTTHQPLRIAVASGNGIGKSAFLSMFTAWALSTCTDAKVLITAGTGKQLATKTQPEMSKWFRLAINNHWFNVKKESISVKNERHADEWRADLVTWDENNPDAFAGLHNKGKRIVLIFDEAAAIASIIWLRAQKALTDEGTEIIWLAFGNPTDNSGTFADCFGVDQYRWKTFHIDARNVEGTNKEELKKDVERYGEDSDFIRYSVRGEFPRRGTAQFIGHDVVAAARRYKAVGYDHLPKIIACDVARFGDDETVFGLRQGRKFDILEAYRGLDTVQTTDRAVELIKKHSPDAIVVDDDGIGGAVLDGLKHRGFNQANGYLVHGFHGGQTAFDKQMYFNRRTECWGLMSDHLREGAQIPDDAELERQLTGPTYHLIEGKVQYGSIMLESKDDMKKRGIESPDRGDCYAMTFAVKIAPKPKPGPPSRPATSWS
jgi:hypothetical protein